MVLVTLKTDILNQLCSEDQLELLDAVDGLRSQGIDSYVSLPQIIVCGDQSSGKSSVLEAISGVPFPVNSNLCTRFPTELVLRKTTEIGVSISIVPDVSHGEPERRALLSFHEKLDNFKELPRLIERAKGAMAISTTGRSFSRDLLRIEISGPDRPHLTIVDLPGLIHSETKQQSASDIELVQDVVRSYMEERRSIILAVISAKNDYANQIVLKLARTADKEGNRTLGVITKPDTLLPGSSTETSFVTLAKNQDVNFHLGWHVLKNLDSDLGEGSLTTRDLEEQKFFASGIWRTLPQTSLGVENLRERLSSLLLEQIANELPSLIKEIESKSQICRNQLEALGKPRASQDEQRMYLLQLSEKYQSITKAALDGSYNYPFFGDAKSVQGYQKRLRAVIQNLNETFASSMEEKGHKYNITDSKEGNQGIDPLAITRLEYMDHIKHLTRRTRGCELPGTYNPMVIADLFAEQSGPWEGIMIQHSEAICSAVKSFLSLLVADIADQNTYEPLFRTVFEPALQKLEEGLSEKLSRLLAEHQKGHPITYDRNFIETVDTVGKERLESKLTEIIQDVFEVASLESTDSWHNSGLRPLLKALMEYTHPIMERPAYSKALDCMETYYKIVLKRFIDNVTIEAVESSMMSKLHEILRPLDVVSMARLDVNKIAGESEKSRNRRIELEAQIDVLNGGIRTCKRIVRIGLVGSQNIAEPGIVSLPERRSGLVDQPKTDAAPFIETTQVRSTEEVFVEELDKYSDDYVDQPKTDSAPSRDTMRSTEEAVVEESDDCGKEIIQPSMDAIKEEGYAIGPGFQKKGKKRARRHKIKEYEDYVAPPAEAPDTF